MSRKGKISTANERICYERGGTSWEIALGDIQVIGEFTNPEGPFFEDYFLCFITDTSGKWYEASFYSQGINKLLDWLEDKLNSNFEWKLCASKSFQSRVMWPAELENSVLFEWRERAPGGPFYRFLRHLRIGSVKMEKRLNESILEYARGKRKGAVPEAAGTSMDPG